MPILPVFSLDDAVFGTPQADSLNGGGGGDLIHGGAGADTISGRGGDDVIYGGRGADALSGGSGSDVFVWTDGDGSDTVNGGSGADTQVVEGNDNGETFRLEADGNDAVFGRTGGQGAFEIELERVETVDVQGLGGNDRLTVQDLSGTAVDWVRFSGGEGADRLSAQNTDVSVRADGGNGADQLTGGSGGDQLFGDGGADTLRGNGGDDWLAGGNGADTLSGGSGDDVLEGGRGNDRLTGGSGDDAYVIDRDGGADTIQGFGNGDDVIVLRGLTAQGSPLTFTELSAQITEQGGDSTIDLSSFGGGSVTVGNATGLAENDFVFL
jgi:Hemolysin-type calcium-binding repeat (2 copies).